MPIVLISWLMLQQCEKFWLPNIVDEGVAEKTTAFDWIGLLFVVTGLACYHSNPPIRNEPTPLVPEDLLRTLQSAPLVGFGPPRISRDDSLHTLEYPKHYVITPSAIEVPITYEKDALDESGQAVEFGFEYSSLTNPHYLTVGEIEELHGK